jgi:hypothetical protein
LLRSATQLTALGMKIPRHCPAVPLAAADMKPPGTAPRSAR